MRKKIVIIGAILSIVGILMIYPGYSLIYESTIDYLPMKTGTISPHDYEEFHIEWPEDGRYEYTFFANDSVEFYSFDEEYYEDFQQGNPINVLDHIENTASGSSWVQGGNGAFYIVFINQGESSVTIKLLMSFIPNYAPLITLAGFALLVIGVVIVIIGFILKPVEAREKEKFEEVEKEREEKLKKQSKKSKMNFRNWFKSLINPTDVFREEKKNVNLVDAVKNVGFSVGLLLAVVYVVLICLFIIMGIEGIIIGIMYCIFLIFFFSLIYILIFLALSGILFLSAKLFGGKGNFTTQTYLISLPFAALIWVGVLFGVLGTILSLSIDFVFSFFWVLVYIYALYPLAMALKEAHNYSTIKAGLSLLPAIIIMILFRSLFLSLILLILQIFTGSAA